jgi:demethylphylloquinone reductase
MQNQPHICILGGGFGGLYTALKLARHAGSVRPKITMIDGKDHFLFTPLFYELISEEMQIWQVAPKFHALLAHTGIEFCQDWVDTVDLDRRLVYLQSKQTIHYDRLVIAVGRQARSLPINSGNQNIYNFRSLPDLALLQQACQDWRSQQHQPIQVAILGGGANGIEVACKLADQLKSAGKIYLIDRRDTLLRGFSIASQKAASRALAQRDVQVILNATMQSFAQNQLTVEIQGQPQIYPIHLLISTIGTEPWPWINRLNCPKNASGQLLTHPTLQSLDYPEVFAIGDVATITANADTPIPTTAQVAFQQSSLLAKNLRASLQQRRLQRFRYCHLGEMLSLGINTAVVHSFGITFSGAIGSFIRRWVYTFRLPTLAHGLAVMRSFIGRSQCREADRARAWFKP